MRNTLLIGGICILALIAGVVLYVSNVGRQASPAIGEANFPQQKNVAIKILSAGEHTASTEVRKNYAIYDPLEFAAFWKRAHGTSGPKPPVIDFDKNYVIAVFAGTEPTGGYHISVTNVVDAGNARSVRVRIEKPGANCNIIEETTSPYQFVSVPSTDLEALAHTDETVARDCN